MYIKSDIWQDRTLEMYLETLGKLEDVLSNQRFDSVYILGDFNADPFIGRAWNHLTDFALMLICWIPILLLLYLLMMQVLNGLTMWWGESIYL